MKTNIENLGLCGQSCCRNLATVKQVKDGGEYHLCDAHKYSQAELEHAALLAVAEAADAIVAHRNLVASARLTTIGELHEDLEKAVSNLAAVRATN